MIRVGGCDHVDRVAEAGLGVQAFCELRPARLRPGGELESVVHRLVDRLDAGAAGQMIGVARQATEQAEESLRILENQYREGLATITDLLDTELAATNSRLSYVQALYGYNLALARVSLVTGGFPLPAQY